MTPHLHLTIATPFAVLADEPAVRTLRAEDASGGFGILPGHMDFLTVLPASVLRWENEQRQKHYCAVRGGLLTVNGGQVVSVVCRQGIVGDDLSKLAAEVKAMREMEADQEHQARTEQMRMHARAVRQLMRYLELQGPDGQHGAGLP